MKFQSELDAIAQMQAEVDECASNLVNTLNNFTEEEATVYFEDGDSPKLNKKKITSDAKAKGDSIEPETKAKLKEIVALWDKQSKTNKAIKVAKDDLESKTIDAIQNLTDVEMNEFLHLKWVTPIISGVNKTLATLLTSFNYSVSDLVSKYTKPYNEIENDILIVQDELSEIIANLTGNEYAIKGLNDFANRLKR